MGSLKRQAIRSLLSITVATATANAHSQENELGANAFAGNCGGCHIGIHPLNPGAPRLAELKKLTPERVRAAVGPGGRMRQNAQWLKPAELEALIRYLTAPPLAAVPAPATPATPAASVPN